MKKKFTFTIGFLYFFAINTGDGLHPVIESILYTTNKKDSIEYTNRALLARTDATALGEFVAKRNLESYKNLFTVAEERNKQQDFHNVCANAFFCSAFILSPLSVSE